jgi:hypothetical protein
MPKRKLSAAAAEIIVTEESCSIEDLQDSTVEEYKKLNENLDKVMSKIKNRKEHKRKK